MPQYKVSVKINAYIDAESPKFAKRLAIDALDALLSNNSRAFAEFEMRYPQEEYPSLAISDISVEDASIEAQQETEAVSQEELDKPEEVV